MASRQNTSGRHGQGSVGDTAGLCRVLPVWPVRPAQLLRGAAACPSAFTPFLKQLEGLELVSRDVFFIGLGKSLSLVNAPVLNNLVLRIGSLQVADR